MPQVVGRNKEGPHGRTEIIMLVKDIYVPCLDLGLWIPGNEMMTRAR
jgi:hypothetical protein